MNPIPTPPELHPISAAPAAKRRTNPDPAAARNLVFVCSGAADVGELTDRAARELRHRGIASMSCLASIGARDPDILFNTEMADRILLIDGCPKACARRTFEHAGLRRYRHFDLSEVGLFKNRSVPGPPAIERVVDRATALLRTSPGEGTSPD